MRVAFTLIGGKNWTGGRNYLVNLFAVLSRHQRDRLTPVLFAGTDSESGDIDTVAAIPGVEIVRTPLMDSSGRRSEIARAVLLGRDVRVQRLFRTQRIDAVFEPARFFGWRLGIPAIAWMPDFLHRAMPELFSRRAWWKREIGLRVQIMGGRTVMLSSETARQECERHYPATRGRARAVRFAVPPREEIPPAEARAIADSYELPEHFFFMPNQYWRHKNHLLVLEALAILRQRGSRIVVVASGNEHDPHAPEHFPAFRRRLEQAGMQSTFRLLGMIPYSHLAPLMRASAALLNPSLFEGWSTTVEEARGIGTPMLLSDLAVHREQMGADATYFDPRSAQSLADVLDAFAPLGAADRARRAEAGRRAANQRAEKFAADFVDLCKFSRARLRGSTERT